MNNLSGNDLLMTIMQFRPTAYAYVKGDANHPNIMGEVLFYAMNQGTLVLTEVNNLPERPGKCTGNVFGYHIHEGNKCSGTAEDPFKDTKAHFNPNGCEHPYHAGDMPPLFENNGFAFSIFYTDRFHPDDIVGRTVVIHDMPDDFKTQPSGNSGAKIACGEIFYYVQ